MPTTYTAPALLPSSRITKSLTEDRQPAHAVELHWLRFKVEADGTFQAQELIKNNPSTKEKADSIWQNKELIKIEGSYKISSYEPKIGPVCYLLTEDQRTLYRFRFHKITHINTETGEPETNPTTGKIKVTIKVYFQEYKKNKEDYFWGRVQAVPEKVNSVVSESDFPQLDEAILLEKLTPPAEEETKNEEAKLIEWQDNLEKHCAVPNAGPSILSTYQRTLAFSTLLPIWTELKEVANETQYQAALNCLITGNLVDATLEEPVQQIIYQMAYYLWPQSIDALGDNFCKAGNPNATIKDVYLFYIELFLFELENKHEEENVKNYLSRLFDYDYQINCLSTEANNRLRLLALSYKYINEKIIVRKSDSAVHEATIQRQYAVVCKALQGVTAGKIESLHYLLPILHKTACFGLNSLTDEEQDKLEVFIIILKHSIDNNMATRLDVDEMFKRNFSFFPIEEIDGIISEIKNKEDSETNKELLDQLGKIAYNVELTFYAANKIYKNGKNLYTLEFLLSKKSIFNYFGLFFNYPHLLNLLFCDFSKQATRLYFYKNYKLISENITNERREQIFKRFIDYLRSGYPEALSEIQILRSNPTHSLVELLEIFNEKEEQDAIIKLIFKAPYFSFGFGKINSIPINYFRKILDNIFPENFSFDSQKKLIIEHFIEGGNINSERKNLLFEKIKIFLCDKIIDHSICDLSHIVEFFSEYEQISYIVSNLKWHLADIKDINTILMPQYYHLLNDAQKELLLNQISEALLQKISWRSELRNIEFHFQRLLTDNYQKSIDNILTDYCLPESSFSVFKPYRPYATEVAMFKEHLTNIRKSNNHTPQTERYELIKFCTRLISSDNNETFIYPKHEVAGMLLYTHRLIPIATPSPILPNTLNMEIA